MQRSEPWRGRWRIGLRSAVDQRSAAPAATRFHIEKPARRERKRATAARWRETAEWPGADGTHTATVRKLMRGRRGVGKRQRAALARRRCDGGAMARARGGARSESARHWQRRGEWREQLRWRVVGRRSSTRVRFDEVDDAMKGYVDDDNSRRILSTLGRMMKSKN
ncbi:hypothetical protein Scep_009409 [Stephania cephalantha]|uniref:Uncharacterized protein n=1 Tax=Stephania cephalantha TaxID=152367 RepID=A0AAP0JUK6_9MAGN